VEAHGDEVVRVEQEAQRLQAEIGAVEGHHRRREGEAVAVAAQAARRLDLAQCRARRNADAGLSLDLRRLFRRRIVQVDPESMIGQARAALHAVVLDRAVRPMQAHHREKLSPLCEAHERIMRNDRSREKAAP
jgi:hypothetical protein